MCKMGGKSYYSGSGSSRNRTCKMQTVPFGLRKRILGECPLVTASSRQPLVSRFPPTPALSPRDRRYHGALARRRSGGPPRAPHLHPSGLPICTTSRSTGVRRRGEARGCGRGGARRSSGRGGGDARQRRARGGAGVRRRTGRGGAGVRISRGRGGGGVRICRGRGGGGARRTICRGGDGATE
jgi:hypothetical protein